MYILVVMSSYVGSSCGGGGGDIIGFCSGAGSDIGSGFDGTGILGEREKVASVSNVVEG